MKTKHLVIISVFLILGIVTAGSVSMFIPNEQVANANFLMFSPTNEEQYTLELTPGASEENTVSIINRANEPVIMNFYGADGINTAEGNFSIKTVQEEQTTVGTWIKFEEKQLEFEPNESKTIPFTVTVPETVPPGTYGGGIAVSVHTKKEIEAEKKAESIEKGGTSMGYKVTNRRIMKVIVKIPGKRKHNFAWQYFGYEKTEQNKHGFNFGFSNTGNTLVAVDGEVEIFGGFNGNTQTEKKAGNIISFHDITLFQGENLEIEELWEKTPSFGKFTAEARLTFWEYDITTGSKISAQSLSKTTTFSVFPWFQLIVIFVIIVLIFLLTIYLKVSHNKFIASCEPYEVKANETIEMIAKKAKIDWKKLAKINKLKPPYGINKGQKIIIPPKNISKILKK